MVAHGRAAAHVFLALFINWFVFPWRTSGKALLVLKWNGYGAEYPKPGRTGNQGRLEKAGRCLSSTPQDGSSHFFS